MNGRTLRWLMSLAHHPRRARAPRLTIIRHHRVYADGERPLYRLGVSESVFAAQLDMLGAMGLAPLTVSEGLERLEGGEPGHWVAMSFDDGYEDNVTRALPLLLACGGRATFYLTAGLMEDRRAPWWDVVAHALERTRAERLAWTLGGEAVELPLAMRADRARAMGRLAGALRLPLAERARQLESLRERLGVTEAAPCELADWTVAGALVRDGMEVGAHTLEHPHLSLLAAADQKEEIAGSAALIERRLQVRPRGVAYPGGDYDAATLGAVAASGLAHAVTTRAGTNRPDTPRFELVRRGLSDGACLDPAGRFSRRLAAAELDGVFDRMRGAPAVSS